MVLPRSNFPENRKGYDERLCHTLAHALSNGPWKGLYLADEDAPHQYQSNSCGVFMLMPCRTSWHTKLTLPISATRSNLAQQRTGHSYHPKSFSKLYKRR
ncbi:unnamed protein product [Arctogadus glacialis]